MSKPIDNKTYKLLKAFYKSQKLTKKETANITEQRDAEKQNSYINLLLENNFVSLWVSEDRDTNGYPKLLGYEITLEGQAYIDQRRREIRDFWVPYTITTIIAVVSLILSIIR